MTRKEKVIRDFAKAMKLAHVPYIAEHGRFTPRMDQLWFEYVDACAQEAKEHAQSK